MFMLIGNGTGESGIFFYFRWQFKDHFGYNVDVDIVTAIESIFQEAFLDLVGLEIFLLLDEACELDLSQFDPNYVIGRVRVALYGVVEFIGIVWDIE